MSFKLHLIIVSIIIGIVYVVWHISASRPVAVAPVVVTKESPYSIQISHASWGLNCRGTAKSGADENNDSFAHPITEADSKLHEDNILVRVSDLCNGKLKCDIKINKEVLGDDPDPTCTDKELNVEYRCFSFDRPWNTHAITGSVLLNCDKKPLK